MQKPLLLHSHSKNNEGTVTSTLKSGAISKNSTLSRNSTLPRDWKDMEYEDSGTLHRHPIKRSNSKASSILSVETVSFFLLYSVGDWMYS